MKKISALFVLFSLLTFASAQATICTFTEDEGSSKEKTTEVLLTGEGAHGMTFYELDMATGFVAKSNGYLVVNVVLRENGQVFSFNTILVRNNAVLGGTVLTPDNSRLLRISCR